MKVFRPFPLVIFLVASAVLPLSAVQIVDWGSTAYVSSVKALGDQNTTSPQGGFSSGDPLLLSPSADYTGPKFYGVVSWASTGNEGDFGTIRDHGGGDQLEIKRANADIKALVLFKQEDFLGGLHTGNVGFDATSTMSTTFVTQVGFDPGRVVLRLQGGSQDGYYISQEAPFVGSGSSAATNSTPLTSLTWLAYDPATSLTTFGAEVDILSDGVIEHVTEVGFYTRSTSSNPNAYRIRGFDVTAVAIPEPASMLTLALAGVALLGFRRRR